MQGGDDRPAHGRPSAIASSAHDPPIGPYFRLRASAPLAGAGGEASRPFAAQGTTGRSATSVGVRSARAFVGRNRLFSPGHADRKAGRMMAALWQRLRHGTALLVQQPDWPVFAGADWPKNIMEVPVVD